MDQLKALHQKLTAKTTDELILDEIKRIQNMLLSYFEINSLKTTDTNVVHYNVDDDLMKNMEILAKSANIVYFEFYEMLRNHNGGFILLNDTDFIKKLLKLLFPIDLPDNHCGSVTCVTSVTTSPRSGSGKAHDPNLHLKIEVEVNCVSRNYEYHQEHTLRFKFSLKDDLKYEEGIHNIVDYLLNEQKKEHERLFPYTSMAKDPNGDTFKLICEQVSKYKESQLLELAGLDKEKEVLKEKFEEQFENLTLKEVNAYLTILGTFDKFDTIEYEYLYLNGEDIGLEYFESYEFTMEQQKILSQLIGLQDQTLQFKYKNHRINIVFDKTNRIIVSDDILEKCKQKLEDSREKARKKLLTFVEKQKTKIIETCCHRLKYYKSAPNNFKNKPFPIDNDFCITGPLVSDSGIITPEVTAEVNKILGIEGFTVSINEMGEPSVCKIEYDTFYHSVSLAFPDSLTFPISIE